MTRTHPVPQSYVSGPYQARDRHPADTPFVLGRPRDARVEREPNREMTATSSAPERLLLLEAPAQKASALRHRAVADPSPDLLREG